MCIIHVFPLYVMYVPVWMFIVRLATVDTFATQQLLSRLLPLS